MDCEQTLLLISADIDREIQPEQRAQLDAHLRECSSCQATADAFRLQHEELRRAFAERRQAAATVAERVGAQLPAEGPPRRNGRRLIWGLSVAASLAGVAALLYLYWPRPPSPTPPDRQPDVVAAFPDRLTARARLSAPPAPALAVGEALETKAGQRRRTTLPDGSVVYLNQNTTVQLDAGRRLTLEKGEVYVEVAPQQSKGEAAPFVVKAARREVTALGTKFAVRAEGEAAGVLVTQGQVRVSGYDGVLHAGQQLAPDADGPVPAPRVSHVLDWARDLMAHAGSPLIPASQYAGGALVAVDPSGQEAKLSLRKYHIDVHVEDGFVRTTIDQTYFNHEPWRLEGTFYFPLPADASLSRLAMYVDGNLMEGGMVERNYGRAVFQEIVDRQKDPALLEWMDGSTFKMRVFPLEGRQEKRIILSYSQRLPALYGQQQYRFPAGHNLEVVRDWSFHARVRNGARLDWVCDSHDLKARKDGADLLLDARAQHVKADRDVQLSLLDSRESGEPVRFSSMEHEGARYLMLRYRPALPVENQQTKIAAPRNWVFLFESSGDRDPLLARVQIDIIQSLLEQVEHTDTFAVLTAGTRVHRFDDEAKLATPENIKAAIEFLERAHLIGALDLGQALATAEQFSASDRETYLVHVGSGIPALGERSEDVLAKRIPERMHYVGVGVGKRWSRSFMKTAAERSGGYVTQINPDEPVAWRAFDLFATLSTPRLLDVKVSDGAGRVPFLEFSSSLSQGEELCAIARIEAGQPMPESVIVGGMLNGKVFHQVIAVKDVAKDAGYLPRTWAKLELDRLLAEDAAKHKNRIIALSKAMYVMTPFTSLLVLENEAMYEQYKVDRGRKDHWAMYPCPQKIPVVYEPDPLQPVDSRGAPQAEKPQANQVMQTVLVRVPPRRLTWGAENDWGGGQQVVTAVELYTRGRDAVRNNLGRLGDTRRVFQVADLAVPLGIDPDMVVGDMAILAGGTADPIPAFLLNVPPPPGSGFGQGGSFRYVPGGFGGRSGTTREQALRQHRFNVWADVWNGQADLMVWPDQRAWFMDGSVRSLAFSPDGRSLAAGESGREWDYRTYIAGPTPIIPGSNSGDRVLVLIDNSGSMMFDGIPVSGEIAGRINLNGIEDRFYRDVLRNVSDATTLTLVKGAGVNSDAHLLNFMYWPNTERILKPLPTGGIAGITFATNYHRSNQGFGPWELMTDGYSSSAPGRVPQLYGRPSFQGDERLFSDFVAYAPGMNTTHADIQAVLEAEAAPDLRSLSGRIDPTARKLIDRARASGWQKLTFPGAKDVPGLAIVLDGSGRFAYERVGPLGLRERVVCDGQTLLHLYPDLGVGASRTVSRFHRAGLSGVAPWLLSPVEDLARGADVEGAGERIVAISPRGGSNAKDPEGKPITYLRTELVFGTDGRLAERRLVEMPAKKVHLRETYEPTGVIKVFDEKDKELATRKLTLSAADEPDLKPDTSGLVVLPLPLRSRQHVYEAYGLHPDKSLDVEENLCLEYLQPAEALEVLTTEFASRHGERARQVYLRCFHNKGDRRLGFCTLLSASSVRVGDHAELAKVLCEHPENPLAAYLALDNSVYRTGQRWSSLDRGAGIGPRGSLLTELAAFRDRWLRWQDGWAGRGSRAARRAEQQQALDFVQQNKANVFGLALLTLIQECAGDDERFHRDLADAWRLLDDGSGLAYTPNYEHARNLWSGGKKAEARARFRELYTKAFEKGLLPPIDSVFREALQGDDENSWSALMRQTAAQLIKDKKRAAVVTLAWQCWQLGDRPLADNLLRLALDGVDEPERLAVTLAAVVFLQQSGQPAPADQLLEPLLVKPAHLSLSGKTDEAGMKCWQMAQLWRLASRIAEQRGLTAEAIARLEEALEIEYRWGPPVINVQEVRGDYGKLLDHYQALADAVAALKLPPPADLVNRTVRAADRWRALDRDSDAPCHKAAHILKALGTRELAWEYLTTPLAPRPSESDPWVGLAQTLNHEGELDLADLAYGAAFDADPTSAQILWDRAQNLQQAGKLAESQKVLRQIADGQWLPRFHSIKEQARWQLRGR